jgi:electron transfer flavoprotein alpha subunit
MVVIAGLATGLPTPVTMELIEFAKSLQDDRARMAPVRVFVLGDGVERAVAILSGIPGTEVTGYSGKQLASYSAEAWKTVLAPRLFEIKPRFVCVAHDSTGLDFAPGLAVRLMAGCITAVEGAVREGDELIFRRSVLNGKMTSGVVSRAETTVLTLLPGTFQRKSTEENSDFPGMSQGKRAEIIPVNALSLKSRPLGLLSAPETDADLTAAEVVVAAGRGMGKEENIHLVRELASLFSRSAVGGSRTVCDAGWLPVRLQIGQTGKTVAPRLYIACGISGALQHLVGMRGAQFIVAVNSDPRAAIFQAADIGVVEDLVTFLPLLTDACRKHRKDRDSS